MSTNRAFAWIILVPLLLSACNLRATPTLIIPDTGGSIGMISPEETLVESGLSGQLVQVSDVENFYNNSAVRVTKGGVAKLDFLENQISIRLFNNTAVDGVTADPSGTPDRAVRMKLVFGGLSGEVTKNGVPAKFEISNRVNIYILGTQFLVLYDTETDTSYIGNFDGTIAYTTPRQPSVQFIQAGRIEEISPTFEIRESTLNFTRADIENLTSSRRSTLLATLKDYLASTPTPTLTPTPSLLPTMTLTSTAILTLIPMVTPPPTVVALCDKAAFVADVTIPDGSSFSPGSQFTKVWRLRNVGTCTWTSSYSLVFYRGEQMGGPTTVGILSTVAPGQTVDISVTLAAPSPPGSSRGEWILRNSSGALFGGGANGATPIWVAINVIGPPTLTPTPTVIIPGTITGIAFSDNNGNGIPDTGEIDTGLTVRLIDIAGNTPPKNTTTDSSGRYTFANLSPSTYSVRWDVSGCNGLETRQATVNVSAGSNQSQNLSTFVLC